MPGADDRFDLWTALEEGRARSEERLKEKLSPLRQEIGRCEPRADLYVDAAELMHQLGLHQEALDLIAGAVRFCSPSRSLYRTLIWHLEQANQTARAIEISREAMSVFPADFYFRMREALLLPVIYASATERLQYRERYLDGARRLLSEVDVESAEGRRSALRAIARHDNFYVGYLCGGLREIMEPYAALVAKIMGAAFPLWTGTCETPPAPPDAKIRIGFVSACIGEGRSVMKTHLGWLRHLDRDTFAVHVYDLRPDADSMTERVRNLSDRYHHFAESFGKACEVIVDEAPHVLIYLDVGVRPITAQMASLRLAPIQCATWDPTFTTGSSAIDYYLSADLNEPVNGQDHYSEELVRLPGTGVCFEKPAVPKLLLNRTRSYFGLRGDAVVFACCQSAFKYMPEQDMALARIAQRVPHAEFIFLVSHSQLRKDLEKRLRSTFSAAGLESDRYCRFLPECSWHLWLNLMLISDAFLDTFDWSGGVTSFEVAACGIPIVTLPGPYMRGRQSLGILRRLGVGDTIARDVDDYVNLAARMGADPAWREDVQRRMLAGHERLFGDTSCVRALEDFLKVKVRAVTSHRLRNTLRRG